MSTLSPQQAPSSQLHPALLFSSSQSSSVANCGDPHPVGVGVGGGGAEVVGGVGVGGHTHCPAKSSQPSGQPVAGS